VPAAPLTLGLIIASRGVKPAVAMKTLSRKVAFVVLAVIAVITIVSCRQLFFAKQRFTLVILQYAEVPDEARFKDALRKLKKNGGECAITFLRKEGEKANENYCNELDVAVKTDKIIKSEVANSAAARESAVNDPNAMNKVTSANPTDIKDVLDALATP
jgi:hypothetical protein